MINICLISDPNFLALNILEQLLISNSIVNVFTDDVTSWQETTMHINSNSKLNISDIKNYGNSIKFNYLIYCGGFVDDKNFVNKFKLIANIKTNQNVKKIYLFPIDCSLNTELTHLQLDENTLIIYIGDLIGPRLNLNSKLILSKTFNEILINNIMTVPVGETYYPLFVSDAAKLISKWLFSFGPYGKEMLVTGPQMPPELFWKLCLNKINNLQIKYNQSLAPRIFPRKVERHIVENNSAFAIGETLNWLSKIKTVKALPPKINSLKIKNLKIKKPKKYTKLIAGIILLLISPLILIIISCSLLLLSIKTISYNRGQLSNNILSGAKIVALVSEKESYLLSKIPLLNILYKETYTVSSTITSTTDAGSHVYLLTKYTGSLMEKMFADTPYIVSKDTIGISNTLSLLNNDISTIEQKLTNNISKNSWVATKILSLSNIGQYKQMSSDALTLTQQLSELIGDKESKTYLILFQNNMELRPTGGFIGSYGLVTFDGGRMTDLTVNDIYSADGQLNGHVEPPQAIKNYLGQANWWFRDSNWDPDFPTSAKRAEWFLDKEIEKKVDGVIAIDLSPIKEILKLTGPIYLSDYNIEITPENLYEKTQAEVESNFFPGTHKKASFLSALSRTLLDEISKFDQKDKLKLSEIIYASFKSRSLQIYLHNETAQSSLKRLGWDGSVVPPVCMGNCMGNLIGLVEANVGCNKANYFIQRKSVLNIDISENVIKSKLTLNLSNQANIALGPSGVYKVYLRAITPLDAEIGSILAFSGNSQEYLSPEIAEVKNRKEVGVYVELLAGETRSIEFNWQVKSQAQNLAKSYGLLIRKQAGVQEYPLTINLNSNYKTIWTNPVFTLTYPGKYVYNTKLSGDLYIKFTY